MGAGGPRRSVWVTRDARAPSLVVPWKLERTLLFSPPPPHPLLPRGNVRLHPEPTAVLLDSRVLPQVQGPAS